MSHLYICLPNKCTGNFWTWPAELKVSPCFFLPGEALQSHCSEFRSSSVHMEVPRNAVGPGAIIRHKGPNISPCRTYWPGLKSFYKNNSIFLHADILGFRWFCPVFLYCVEKKLFYENFGSPVANSRLKGQIGQYSVYQKGFVLFIHIKMKTLWCLSYISIPFLFLGQTRVRFARELWSHLLWSNHPTCHKIQTSLYELTKCSELGAKMNWRCVKPFYVLRMNSTVSKFYNVPGLSFKFR